jgi:membrane associated rhomboid family serine protease
VTILDRLERHFSRFAIPGLIRYVVACNAMVFVLFLTKQPIIEWLTLDPTLILQGQVWRLVTWIFIPNTDSLFFILFFLMFTWWLGDMLEAAWGSFRLNIYYLLGMAGGTLAAFIFGASAGNYLLTFSMLLALATLAPDEQILFLFFPLKLKWVACISLLPLGYNFVTGGVAMQMMIAMCLLNYFIFFAPRLLQQMRSTKQVATRRARFQAASLPDETLHLCATCGITEITHPEVNFRVASNGHEYCADHLPTAN